MMSGIQMEQSFKIFRCNNTETNKLINADPQADIISPMTYSMFLEKNNIKCILHNSVNMSFYQSPVIV